ITLEDHSRNTVENAVYSKAIVQPKPGERWLLVTSAYHIPRAIGVFRKAGFPVEPYPVDWRTRGVEDALHPFATVSDGLRRTDTAVHEWVGLAVILAHWAQLEAFSSGNSRALGRRRSFRRSNRRTGSSTRSLAATGPKEKSDDSAYRRWRIWRTGGGRASHPQRGGVWGGYHDL